MSHSEEDQTECSSASGTAVRCGTGLLRRVSTVALLVSLAGSWQLAWAQDSDNASNANAPSKGTLEEVMVTAERRETSLQDTPIAITAMTGSTMEAWNITNADDFAAAVPGLLIGQTVGALQISLRGVSNDNFFLAGDSPVAFNMDGIFRGRQTGGNSVFFDIERVEVLKGPQGTLYGRNATAGAINVITNKPTSEFGGHVEMEVGDYNLFGVRGVLNAPVIEDTLAIRIAFLDRQRDGYYDNGPLIAHDYSDVDETAVRVQALYTPTERLSMLFHISAENRGGVGDGTQTLPGADSELSDIKDPWVTFLNTEGVRSDEFRTYSTEINYDFDKTALTYLGAYLDTSVDIYSDFDGGDVLFDILDVWVDSQQYTHELRWASTGDNKIDWLMGAFYFDEDVQRLNDNWITRGNGDILNAKTSTPDFRVNSKALFGQATWNLSETLGFTGGLRYTKDEKFEHTISQSSLNGIPIGPFEEKYKDDWDSVDWTIGTEWYPVEETLVYGKVSTGYKSGGFNSIFAVLSDGLTFDPEDILAYQVGHKSRFAGDTIQLNSEVFYYDYTNLQVNQLIDNTSYVKNAATAEIFGVDSDIIWMMTDDFRADFGVSYLDATYGNYIDIDPFTRELVDLSGEQMSKAPKWSGRLALQYNLMINDWTIIPRLAFSFSSSVKLTPFEDPGRLQPSWTKTDLSLDVISPSGAWLTQLFLTNLEDEMVWTNGRLSGSGIRQMNGRPPMMYGLRLRYNFGN